jgi:hypothetical protein
MACTGCITLRHGLARWREVRAGRLPVPGTRAILAVLLGCALLTLHTLTASAAATISDPGPLGPGTLRRICETTPCIGPVTIQQNCTADSGLYADFSFTTSIAASIVLGASTQLPVSPVYYNEFAHVDAATMQVLPTTQHTVRLTGLKQATTYSYALIAVVDAQHKARVEGSFTVEQLIDGCGPGGQGVPAAN